ncbi:hypothetical protein RHMOL_Rhmol01G0224000 [Rhododendron molle]|uniref:Uncharacterized protein n=1 Tax=Rhododendron molle TaxID=49168 RepID=A0ACC0Q6A6_RHOML|nr:hypothetical protein RHMOL_Rhmol01G0224000 [Rhododendron molle]
MKTMKTKRTATKERERVSEDDEDDDDNDDEADEEDGNEKTKRTAMQWAELWFWVSRFFSTVLQLVSASRIPPFACRTFAVCFGLFGFGNARC